MVERKRAVPSPEDEEPRTAQGPGLFDCFSVDTVSSFARNLEHQRPLLAARRLVPALAGSTEFGQTASVSRVTKGKKLRSRTNLTREQVEQLVARYRAGAQTTELMQEFGISKSAVLRWLQTAEVSMRRQPLTSDEVSAARRRYEEGSSLAAISKALGLPRETVRRALIANGVVMRPRGGQVASA